MASPTRNASAFSELSSPNITGMLRHIPSFLAYVGGCSSEASSSQKSEPPKELVLYDLDPELLRGVPLDVALGKCGSYWAIPDNGMLNVDPRLYQLSRPVTSFHHFLSHDWHTSRWLKYLSLLVLFNSRPAAIATLLVSTAVGLASGLMGLRGGAVNSIPGEVVFLLVFCFWQRLRRLITCRPVMVFMDKLCIAQHDDRLKEAGILGLAAFLNCSKRLTILWSPRYFARLWCTFEVATFLNQREGKHIEIIPVGMSLLLILLAVHMKLQALCLHISLHVQDWEVTDESTFFDGVLMTFVESCLMLPLILYIGIGLMKEVEELPVQLNTFEVRKTKCFCCTSKHKHPDTGEKLMCDRRVVYKQLRDWYGQGGKTKAECLNSFDQHVREGLASIVMKSVGGGWYVGYSMTLIYGALMPSIGLWIHEAFVGPDDQYLVGQDKARWVIRCLLRLAHQPVLSVLTLWLYMAMCKAGVILTVACSQLGAALILLVPLLIVEFIFKMPLEFFMEITDDTSLIPLIPFAFSTALAGILWWMTTWSLDVEGEPGGAPGSGGAPPRPGGKTRSGAPRSTMSRKELQEAKPKNFVESLKEYGWERAVSHKSSINSAERESGDESNGSGDTVSI